MNIGKSAMSANQTALGTIANNIANAGTTGFKAQNTVFEEAFYQQMKAASSPSTNLAGTNPMDSGNGVKVGALQTDFSQGTINSTGKVSDLAIQGDGFFVIGDANGENKVYTRAGNFEKSKDNELVTNSGQYVLGWNYNKLTGNIDTSASLEPLKIPLGEISTPNETSQIALKGNLNVAAEKGEVSGIQVSTYDRLGGKHDVDINFIKQADNSFTYVAVPTDQFKPSGSITDAVLHISEGLANVLQKGDYTITTTPNATSGMVDIKVLDPSGAPVLQQTVSDKDQTITLSDGTNKWFSIEYKSGHAPSTASFTIGEVGKVGFDQTGKVDTITGSGGSPKITYTPDTTGQPVTIDLDLTQFTGLSSKSALSLASTDGSGAATMTNYTITDGGQVQAYYSDGSIRAIGQVAMATFSNTSGLSHIGSGNYQESPNSGVAEVGVPNTGSRGDIKGQSLEASNVDLANEFILMLTTQKNYQADTKVIRTSDDALSTVIDLIR